MTYTYSFDYEIMQLPDNGGIACVLSNITTQLGDYKDALQVSPKVVGGMDPRQATEPGSSSKTTGLAPPLNTGARLAGSLDLAKPRKPARLADPARHVDSASTTSARQPNPARPKPPQ